MSNNHPICKLDRCAACRESHCVILKSNNFNGKPCPFFKTKERCEEESRRTMERLLSEGRTDLIELYYGGGSSEC